MPKATIIDLGSYDFQKSVFLSHPNMKSFGNGFGWLPWGSIMNDDPI